MEIRQKRSLHKDWIDNHAYKIVERLQKSQHTSYLVGGCVRDLLVGLPPKDFDIVTDASPNQVKKIIRNAYVIGKRFRLVLVYRYKKIFEVATFRREATKEELVADDDISKDNYFGTPLQDASRRDFTVNALFYDCVSDDLIDYVDGLADIDAAYIRMIGDPDTRLIEDPIRILRALRLSHKLRFQIEPSLRQSMIRNVEELKQAALPRVREDFLKIFRLPDPFRALCEAYDLGILGVCFPALIPIWQNPKKLEAFRYYLSFKDQVISDEAEPAEELAFIIYVYLQVVGETKKFSAIIKDFKESKHADFLKNELFLFNAEASWVRKVFTMIEKVSGLDCYTIKAKTRNHILNQKHLEYALPYLKLDYLADADQIAYWEKELQKL